MEKKAKIIIAGGGSGGHMLPMLSVAKVLENKYEVIILGGRSNLEKEVFQSSKYKIHRIFSGKIHRYHSLTAYLDNILNILYHYITSVYWFKLLIHLITN